MENSTAKINEVKKGAIKVFKDLLSFEKSFFLDFITIIHIVAQSLAFVFYIYVFISTGDIFKILGAILVYPIVFFAIRFAFEFLSVLFSMNKNLVDIKQHLKK